jgi:CRISPR/Cas system-associated endoribonuclease Cas2
LPASGDRGAGFGTTRRADPAEDPPDIVVNRPVLIVYDITDDRRRAQIRALLEGVADRIQQSGWLAPAAAGVSAARIVAAFSAVTHPTDRVRAHEPYPAGARRARWLPPSSRTPWPAAPAGSARSGWLISPPG